MPRDIRGDDGGRPKRASLPAEDTAISRHKAGYCERTLEAIRVPSNGSTCPLRFRHIAGVAEKYARVLFLGPLTCTCRTLAALCEGTVPVAEGEKKEIYYDSRLNPMSWAQPFGGTTQ